jgi:predicted nucleic acid-binding protein
MIVVDTNVLAYLWLPGSRTTSAEALLRKDSEWHAPLLWRSEFRNVLAGEVRGRRLALEAARRIATEAESQMNGREYAVPASEVLRHAAASGCSAYDCEFVVLAETLGVPLYTSEQQVLAAFPSLARPL